jgi:hypothetical protein
MLSGDEKTGRAILRNYINATVGFRQLEEATSIPAGGSAHSGGSNVSSPLRHGRRPPLTADPRMRQ